MSLDSFKQSVPSFLAYFAAWILLSALSIILIFTCRDALFVSAVWLQFNPWVVRALDRFAIVIFGLIAFMHCIWLEYYLRRGRESRQLGRRIYQVAKIQAAILIISLTIKLILT